MTALYAVDPVLTAGVDEAGRGPLAGDVVAAAVILNPDDPIDGLRDSKKLTERRREQLFDEIMARALACSVARATVAEIDSINILQASLLAMSRAVAGLATAPELVLVDGNRLPQWQWPARAEVKGDDRFEAIAAASILAKVTRDREMLALHAEFPAYGFDRHKGYPTAAHLRILNEVGISPYHRRSFGPVKQLLTVTSP